MRLLGLGLLAFLLCALPSFTANAADYPPDLVCYNKTPAGLDNCAANEYIQECNTHPMTHLAMIGGVMRCVDNAPIVPPPLLDAWYPAVFSGYLGWGCIVPNTFIYVGPLPVPPNSCVSTVTTPQDDTVGWFCLDNVNYWPQWGPQGYKCVLIVPVVCPGIPPHHLSKIPGYEAYECLPNNPAPPTCSSTETSTVVFPGPPPQSTCIQNWPWLSTTIPPAPACAAGESLISNGLLAPNDRYGCSFTGSCPAGQSMQQVSGPVTLPGPPPTVIPAVFACQPPPSPSCPAGQTIHADALVNPVHYHCCPDGDTLNINRSTVPPTYTCVAPIVAPPPPACPAGQTAVATPPGDPYYICSPPAGAPCPAGQNRQSGVCVANSGHVPTCAVGQTPTLITPTGVTYVCQVTTPTCPAGQMANVTNYSPLTYVCVPDPNALTCPAGQHLEAPGPGAPEVCVVDPPGLPPTCPAGQYATMTSAGPPPVYVCSAMPAIPACPPGQYAAITNYAPITYGCTNGGN